jgi:predicted transcriptional regulator of viral defense system
LTLTELRNNFDSSEKAILQSIYRLKAKNLLAQVRKEFYVILPPQYAGRGMIPPTLFIGDLMAYLQRDYYVCLLSASALHGAGHQQPMQFQVMTPKPPLRSIRNEKLDLRFYIKSVWQPEDLVQIKTEAGYICVSSPALTAFDLVHYNKQIGGLNRILPILEDLAERLKASDLSRTSGSQQTPDLQRLGYLLDQLGNEKLASALYQTGSKKVLRPIPISLAHQDRRGELNSKWNVIINTDLDF